jgi:hypothetical protein
METEMIRFLALTGTAIYFLSVPALAGFKCDYATGNCYQTNNFNGTTRVYGNNMQNGTNWNTTIQQNGNMRGTDSDGNMWNYNAQSKIYSSSDGTTCYGEGASRNCY